MIPFWLQVTLFIGTTVAACAYCAVNQRRVEKNRITQRLELEDNDSAAD
jgi:hypothetical protein